MRNKLRKLIFRCIDDFNTDDNINNDVRGE